MGGQSWQDRRILIQVSLNERRGNVGTIIDEKDARGVKEMLLRDLDLEQVCSFHSTSTDHRLHAFLPAFDLPSKVLVTACEMSAMFCRPGILIP